MISCISHSIDREEIKDHFFVSLPQPTLHVESESSNTKCCVIIGASYWSNAKVKQAEQPYLDEADLILYHPKKVHS